MLYERVEVSFASPTRCAGNDAAPSRGLLFVAADQFVAKSLALLMSDAREFSPQDMYSVSETASRNPSEIVIPSPPRSPASRGLPGAERGNIPQQNPRPHSFYEQPRPPLLFPQ